MYSKVFQEEGISVVAAMQLSTTTEVHIFAVCFSLEYTEFALFFMSNNISFKSLEFYGIDSIEPEFSPSVTQYTIHRQAGSNFQFKASLNIEPLQPTEDDGWNFQPYPGRTLEYNVLGTEYKSFWSVDSWNAIGCPPGEEKMYIAVCPTKRETLHSFCIISIFLTKYVLQAIVTH